NTIDFIDSTLTSIGRDLKMSEKELRDFSIGRDMNEFEGSGGEFSAELRDYDVQRDGINRKIAYLNMLKNYLRESTDYAKLPAPTVAGIVDPNINVNVSKLISLSTQRSEMAYTVKSDKMFSDFDVQIEALKRVILENINTARNAVNYDLNMVNAKIRQIESKINTLPKEKQEYAKIMRKYNLNEGIIAAFMSKKHEAVIVKAANLTDIHFIDPANDIGGGLIRPITVVTYVIAQFLQFLIPMLYVFGIIFF